MEWLFSLLLILADNLVQTDELASPDAMLTQEAHAFLSVVDGVNYDMIEVAARGSHCTVVLRIDCPEVTEPTEDSLKHAIPLCFH